MLRYYTCGKIYLWIFGWMTYIASGDPVTRCYGEKFDSLMCPPNEAISIAEIFATASTTGTCRRSQGDCPKELIHNHAFTIRAKMSCDGKPSCDNLTADESSVLCDEVADRQIMISQIKLEYKCQTAAEVLHYLVICPRQSYHSQNCLGETGIQSVAIYSGLMRTPQTCNAYVGDCVHRLDESSQLFQMYRQKCDGGTTCRANVSSSITGPCGGPPEDQYILIVYRCVPVHPITTQSPVHPITTQSISPASSTETYTLTGGTPDSLTTEKSAEGSQLIAGIPIEIIIAVPVAAFVLLLVVALAVCLAKRRKRADRRRSPDESAFGAYDISMTTTPEQAHRHIHADQPPLAVQPKTHLAPYANVTHEQTYNLQNNNCPNPYATTLAATEPAQSSGYRSQMEIINAPYPYDQVAFSPKPPEYDGTVFTVVSAENAQETDREKEKLSYTNVQTLGDMAPKGRAVYSQVCKVPAGRATVTEETGGVHPGGDEDDNDTVIVDNTLYGRHN